MMRHIARVTLLRGAYAFVTIRAPMTPLPMPRQLRHLMMMMLRHDDDAASCHASATPPC